MENFAILSIPGPATATSSFLLCSLKCALLSPAHVLVGNGKVALGDDDMSMCLSVSLAPKYILRLNLHLREFERVVSASPVKPVNTVSVWRVIASQVTTVQVGMVTTLVPPGSFVRHSTRVWVWPHVVVLVSSAEFLSQMGSEWITFRQQTLQQFLLLDSRASIPLRPWSKIPLPLALPLPSFFSPLPLVPSLSFPIPLELGTL